MADIGQMATDAAVHVAEKVETPVIDFLINLAAAVLILWAGKLLIKRLLVLLRKLMEKRKIDEMLIGFAVNASRAMLWTVVVVAVLGKLGVDATSLVAMVGAAGLAIGMAMRKHIGNIAAGVLIIMFKPFGKGDMVIIGGKQGKVQDVDIINTKVVTLDGQLVIIPNNNVVNKPLINIAATPNLRVEVDVVVPYDADLDQAQEIIRDILANDERVLPKPKARVYPINFKPNGVAITFRPWATNGNWWALRCDLIGEITKRFQEAGIRIPVNEVFISDSGAADGTVAAPTGDMGVNNG